jgi:ATP-dependent Clp protease ATP-binding subunit ClpA
MIAQLSPTRVVLELEKKSSTVREFESILHGKIVGQDEAVSQLVSLYQTVLAGMAVPERPIASLLFLGPTGSGKTRLVEAAAESLFGSSTAFIKVDCAEFQHSHDIAKLIGSPPGYIGHRETQPVFTQQAIDRFQTDKLKLAFVLFDEIEKASDALWQLMLGILDKATLTLGDNQRVDFSRTVVVMTSNLGATEMSRLISGTIGFVAPTQGVSRANSIDGELRRVAVDAAKRRFSPEFMNRIDKVIVFRTLAEDDLRKILDIELERVQRRIMDSQGENKFSLQCTQETKEFLLKEGTDTQYGARHLRRAIERHLVIPLSSLIGSSQIAPGDDVVVDCPAHSEALVFSKTLQAVSDGTSGQLTRRAGARLGKASVQ